MAWPGMEGLRSSWGLEQAPMNVSEPWNTRYVMEAAPYFYLKNLTFF